ncbi:PleD family two-component system response regulator [Elusimicrobiota bacterium]
MMTILVADDDDMFRDLVNEILTQGGYKVILAKDGQEGWDLLQKEKIDMAVLDLNMPNMDGMELTKKVRETPQLQNLPILMLTVRALVEDQVSGYERGADDYLTKPFESKMLLARIKVMERRIL